MYLPRSAWQCILPGFACQTLCLVPHFKSRWFRKPACGACDYFRVCEPPAKNPKNTTLSNPKTNNHHPKPQPNPPTRTDGDGNKEGVEELKEILNKMKRKTMDEKVKRLSNSKPPKTKGNKTPGTPKKKGKHFAVDPSLNQVLWAVVVASRLPSSQPP